MATTRPDLALLKVRRWPDGWPTIRIHWLDGDPEVHKQIEDIEAGPDGWSSASALGFTFVNDINADARVTFTAGGSWSYVGYYPLPVPMASMQLGWLRKDTPREEVRRVWLHEAGHLLGFHHEHDTTKALADIPWDWDGIKSWCFTHGMTFEQWQREWLNPILPEQIDQPEYDKDSIMHYHIPAQWVLDRQPRGTGNRLSAGDRRMVPVWYGNPPRTSVYLPIVHKD